MVRTRRFDLRRPGQFLALAAIACLLPALAAGPAAPRTTLKVGGHELKVEVAGSEPARARGLMFREKLGRDEGMLFVFDAPAYHSMWMKNTPLPLSVAFVDRKGVILNIRDMEPHTLDTHQAAGPALYAIETHRGWFAERRIEAGDRVAGLPPPR